jgi:hypothetical protein
LRKELRLRVFENRVVGRLFGPKKAEVTGELRKLHNEGFNDLYSTPTIIRVIKSLRMGWARHAAGRNERRDVYSVLVEKPEGRKPFGRPRHSWEDNIKIDLQ